MEEGMKALAEAITKVGVTWACVWALVSLAMAACYWREE